MRRAAELIALEGDALRSAGALPDSATEDIRDILVALQSLRCEEEWDRSSLSTPGFCTAINLTQSLPCTLSSCWLQLCHHCLSTT